MVYSLITFLIFTLSLQLQSKTNKSYTKIYYFIFLGLFLFSAFRYEVGCDWFSYENMFEAAEEKDFASLFAIRDPLFWILQKWVSYMNLPYPVINIISSALFFMGVHVLARRQPSPIAFLVLIFPILIINMPMSAIRQAAAIGMICIAVVAIIDKRPLNFLLWVLVATGLHTSAIVFLVLLPFTFGRYDNFHFMISGVFAIAVLYFLSISGSGVRASSVYIGAGREAYGALYRTGMLALSGLYFFLFIKRKWQKTFPKDFGVISLSALGMILLFFSVPLSTIISDRYGYYLIPFQAIIFARLPFLQFKLNYFLHCALPYICLLFAFIVWTLNSWHFSKCYLPYNSWIFGFPNGFTQ